MTDAAAQADPEFVEEPTTQLMRRPNVPVTLNDLAALKGEALEIIDARVQILETVRKAAIRATSPEDWLLFKSPEDAGGQITGYLQDCGADRVRDLYGIEIFDISKPDRVGTNDPKIFHYLISGSGICKLTRQTVESMEGGRSSTDDFCKDKQGADLELAVRKAARANLDGNITRELAGLKSVPIKELEEAWAGTTKKTDHCRRGRGFGTRNERLGANKESAPDVEPPTCKYCGKTMQYREGRNGRGAFYGCPDYQKHSDKKFTVDAEKWVAEQQKKAATATTTEPPPAAPAKAAGEPPTQAEIFK